MKRLLILAAAAMLVAGSVGCDCCRWCRRGAFMPTAPEPCCDPCMSAPTYNTPMPGPEQYVPG